MKASINWEPRSRVLMTPKPGKLLRAQVRRGTVPNLSKKSSATKRIARSQDQLYRVPKCHCVGQLLGLGHPLSTCALKGQGREPRRGTERGGEIQRMMKEEEQERR